MHKAIISLQPLNLVGKGQVHILLSYQPKQIQLNKISQAFLCLKIVTLMVWLSSITTQKQTTSFLLAISISGRFYERVQIVSQSLMGQTLTFYSVLVTSQVLHQYVNLQENSIIAQSKIQIRLFPWNTLQALKDHLCALI